jgi:hypothetical protein
MVRKMGTYQLADKWQAIWSREDWIKMDKLFQSISIYMTHVDAQQGKAIQHLSITKRQIS